MPPDSSLFLRNVPHSHYTDNIEYNKLYSFEWCVVLRREAEAQLGMELKFKANTPYHNREVRIALCHVNQIREYQHYQTTKFH